MVKKNNLPYATHMVIIWARFLAISMYTVILRILTTSFLLVIIHNKVPKPSNDNDDQLNLLSEDHEDGKVTNSSTSTNRQDRLRKRKLEQLIAQQAELLEEYQTGKKFEATDINNSNEMNFIIKNGFLDDDGVLKIDG